MIWGVAYVVCLAALFVRVRSPDAAPPPPLRPLLDEPLALVIWHHRLFHALLLAAPLEVVVRGGRPGGRLLGLVALATGVALYRVGGTALGDALSPFVLPRPGAGLVTHGPYRWVRHPMYLGQALIAAGAPLALGARWTFVLTGAALVVLIARIALEEAALERTYPEFPQYARQAKRILPFLF